ncbi:hypothetical protein [Aliikangiella coralliicola]|uniref:HPr kinase/phosphorylase C-terminal domain-containing protein n=1 Tax=Aliikangiella coralliicola TaxID=2592383 RepID=A0A545U7C0_9GAMM|nr:hypothetical protein [Aliikangiella coralliicola]TQV85354.1 hypothetical protein FLL46_19500 [Aliikangiella coralliicola]
MRQYNAFGLNIASEFELPSLISTSFKKADVCIRKGSVCKKGLKNPWRTRPFCQQAPSEIWLHVPEVARFYITRGNEVIVEPCMNSDQQSVRLFILGSCLGAVMHQRNRLVIHGNAIRIGDSCVIFAGKSGTGKSTLAAAFYQRGYEVLADDLSVIDQQLNVQPSYPQIKLWHDTVEKLGLDICELNKIRLQIDKYAYPMAERFCQKPLPVRAVYVLNNHRNDQILFQAIEGGDKLPPLKNHTYRRGYIDGLGIQAQHFKLCSQLANQIEMTRVTRPSHKFEIDRLVESIEADLRGKVLAA